MTINPEYSGLLSLNIWGSPVFICLLGIKTTYSISLESARGGGRGGIEGMELLVQSRRSGTASPGEKHHPALKLFYARSKSVRVLFTIPQNGTVYSMRRGAFVFILQLFKLLFWPVI